MKLIHTGRFWKDYHKLSLTVQGQVDKALTLLAENPHHPSLRTHKRRGEGDVWQARVTRSYRIYFIIEGDEAHLLAVVPHEK